MKISLLALLFASSFFSSSPLYGQEEVNFPDFEQELRYLEESELKNDENEIKKTEAITNDVIDSISSGQAAPERLKEEEKPELPAAPPEIPQIPTKRRVRSR